MNSHTNPKTHNLKRSTLCTGLLLFCSLSLATPKDTLDILTDFLNNHSFTTRLFCKTVQRDACLDQLQLLLAEKKQEVLILTPAEESKVEVSQITADGKTSYELIDLSTSGGLEQLHLFLHKEGLKLFPAIDKENEKAVNMLEIRQNYGNIWEFINSTSKLIHSCLEACQNFKTNLDKLLKESIEKFAHWSISTLEEREQDDEDFDL